MKASVVSMEPNEKLCLAANIPSIPTISLSVKPGISRNVSMGIVSRDVASGSAAHPATLAARVLNMINMTVNRLIDVFTRKPTFTLMIDNRMLGPAHVMPPTIDHSIILHFFQS
jgi:hypothetical protein